MPSDPWSSKAYNSAASFVPKLTSTVVSYLDAQPNDRILDLGCGDGELTINLVQAQLAAAGGSNGKVLGLDASRSFISSAQERASAQQQQQQQQQQHCTFAYQDCTRLRERADAVDGSWDKVFSNAAMHWILRNPDTRFSFFDDVRAALKPGGLFVFEQGGEGNVAEVRAAATAALVHVGVPLHEAREACPWFFPGTEWMTGTLEKAGFEVLKCELEYRPTRLTATAGSDGGGGLEGWLRLMCAQYLEQVPEDKKQAVLKEMGDVIYGVITRDDGSQWLGYTRLRAVARKK